MINRYVALEDKLLNELMKKKDYTDNKVTGAVLSGVAAMYKATGDEKFLMSLKIMGDEAIDKCTYDNKESLKNYACGNGLYEAFKATGDDRYRQAAKEIAVQFDNQPRYEEGFFKGSDDNGVKRLCRTYMYVPFYMIYETLDGGKERYNDIIAQVRSYRNNLFEISVAKLGSDEDALHVTAHFAAALIDAMENMDQMLYEIYHEMLDYFRDTVKAVIDSGVDINRGTAADYLFGYAVLKGCRMKALITEKYENDVLGLLDIIEDKSGSGTECGCDKAETADVKDKSFKNDSATTLAYKALYYSEVIRNREYQDYGRGKGGVLWS